MISITATEETGETGAGRPEQLQTTTQPILAVERLKKSFPLFGGPLNRTFGHVHAVDDVSFAIGRGETLGVVGESGCGKSTLARLLMFLVRCDIGQLTFDGETIQASDLKRIRHLRRNMQLVFQDNYSSLNPYLSAAESIAYGPRVNGSSRSDAHAIAHSLLEKVGLRADAFAGRYPHELSGGQKQRINIARALAIGPRILILDEAVSALDKSVQAQVLNLLADLKEDLDLTYVFISHDLHVVQHISDRVLVMYLGQVVETGPSDEVYQNPRHPYTKALLACRLSVDPSLRIDLPPLAGDPPSPIDLPSGCRFRTRCPYAEEICEAVAPAFDAISAVDPAFHLVRCHIAQPGSGHSMAGSTLTGKSGDEMVQQ